MEEDDEEQNKYPFVSRKKKKLMEYPNRNALEYFANKFWKEGIMKRDGKR